MRYDFLIRSFFLPTLLKHNSDAPGISLTSDDGTWFQSDDYYKRRKLALLFINSLKSAKIDEWLQSFQTAIEQFENSDTKLVCVAINRPDRLRKYRQKINITYPLLYDPLAFEARRLGMSHRRPICKVGVLTINNEAKIALASWKMLTPSQVLESLNEKTEAPLPKSGNVKHINTDQALALMAQNHLLVDVRTTSEYDADHVQAAIHLPIDELQSRMTELPQKSKLIFICQAGGRAYSAAEFMHSIGEKEIYVLQGGMSTWSGPRITGGNSKNTS